MAVIGEFASWREAVERRLATYLAAHEAEVKARAALALPIVEQVGVLTLRGGKRTRAMLVLAAAECVTDAAPFVAPLLDVCSALELLHTCLLIHDDWMDREVLRRGGASVHLAMAELYGDAHRGASAAVLAGDLALTLSQDLVFGVEARDARALRRAWIALQCEAMWGQSLELLTAAPLEQVYDLKTTSYSVRGPLALGHAVVGGDAAMWQALTLFAAPVGQAYQLRDDVLGVIGDPQTTGKRASDLEAGRFTAPVVAALRRLSQSDAAVLTALVHAGNAESAAQAAEMIRRCGALDEIETQIAKLHESAVALLQKAALRPHGRDLLLALTGALTQRAA